MIEQQITRHIHYGLMPLPFDSVTMSLAGTLTYPNVSHFTKPYGLNGSRQNVKAADLPDRSYYLGRVEIENFNLDKLNSECAYVAAPAVSTEIGNKLF